MKTTTRLGLGVSALAALIAWLGRRPSARGPVGAPGYPYVERRGPNRAVNVVRPAFGRRPARALPNASGGTAESGDWEAF